MKAVQILMMGGNDGKSDYGYLYNSNAALDTKIMPTNWKIPENSDFITLNSYLSSNQGGKLKETGTTYWKSPNTDATNSTGFSARGGGYIWNNGFKSEGIKEVCKFWTQTTDDGDVYYAYLNYDDGTFYVNELNYLVNEGFSIKGVYSGTGTPSSTITDYDGNIYDVIQIGTQYWMKQNYKCTHLNDGTAIKFCETEIDWSTASSPQCAAYDYDKSYV